MSTESSEDQDDIWYYLAGPMSGLPEYNYPAFEAACKYLREDIRLHVRSPHELKYEGSVRGDQPYSSYMLGGLWLLMTCNRIIMLPGWTRSKGARRELDVALDCDMPAFILTEEKLLRELDTGGRFTPWSP